jgi:hypothetical protein
MSQSPNQRIKKPDVYYLIDELRKPVLRESK